MYNFFFLWYLDRGSSFRSKFTGEIKVHRKDIGPPASLRQIPKKKKLPLTSKQMKHKIFMEENSALVYPGPSLSYPPTSRRGCISTCSLQSSNTWAFRWREPTKSKVLSKHFSFPEPKHILIDMTNFKLHFSIRNLFHSCIHL